MMFTTLAPKQKFAKKNPWNLKHRGKRKGMNFGGGRRGDEWGYRYLMGQKLKEFL
jgi:hypothetical protein